MGKLDYQEGFQKAIFNATSLLGISKLASEMEEFGIGSSLAILSAEEGIKAWMCAIKIKYPNDEIENFNETFTNHKIKHAQILDASKITRELIVGFLRVLPAIKIRRDSILSRKIYSSKTQEMLDANIESLERLARDSQVFEEKEFADWWSTANNQKNNGLYVNKINSQWHTPKDVKKDTYDKAHKYASSILEYAQFILGFDSIIVALGLNIKKRK